jgi:hypothetical protein
MNTRNIALAALLLAVAPISPSFAARVDTTYATQHANEPAIPDGMGRIYFYREGGFMGAAVQPSIKIDGVATGGYSVPGDYFYVDHPAGSVTVGASTEKEESTQVDIVAGKPVYVKTEVSMGFLVGHVSPSVVDEATAMETLKDCDLEKFELHPAAAPVALPAPAATTPAPAATPAPDAKTN